MSLLLLFRPRGEEGLLGGDDAGGHSLGKRKRRPYYNQLYYEELEKGLKKKKQPKLKKKKVEAKVEEVVLEPEKLKEVKPLEVADIFKATEEFLPVLLEAYEDLEVAQALSDLENLKLELQEKVKELLFLKEQEEAQRLQAEYEEAARIFEEKQRVLAAEIALMKQRKQEEEEDEILFKLLLQ